MPIYEIRSFSGGLAEYDDKGIPGSFKFGANLSIRRKTDSLYCNQDLLDEGLHSSRSPSASVSPSSSSSRSPSPSVSRSPSPTASPSASASPSVSVSLSPSTTPSSSISPSPSPSNGAGVTTIFQDLILWFVEASDGYTYGFGDQGFIYRRDADRFWQIVYKDPDGRIRGATERPSSSGKKFLVWCTATQVKQKEIPGKANWNDVNATVNGQNWPKVNLQYEDWHMMTVVGGSTMIANGSYLAMIGYDDSYTNEALDLIPGNIVKTLVERDGRVIIGTVRASYPTKGVNSALDTELPLAQVGVNGEIFFADMNSSIPAKTFPGGGKTNPGGACNEIEQVNFFEWEQTALSYIDKQSVGNMALFAVYDAEEGKGGVYSYGRLDKNKPFALNLEYQLDADELGAITTVNDITLVSYRDGSTYGVKATDEDNKAVAVYEGLDFRSPIKQTLDQITPYNTAEIFCDPLPSGTSIEFWYKVNKDEDFIRASCAGADQFSATGERKGIFTIGSYGEIFEPRVVLNPSGNVSPEVHRIRVQFS